MLALSEMSDSEKAQYDRGFRRAVKLYDGCAAGASQSMEQATPPAFAPKHAAVKNSF